MKASPDSSPILDAIPHIFCEELVSNSDYGDFNFEQALQSAAREQDSVSYFLSRDEKLEFLGLGDFFENLGEEISFEERLARADFFLAEHPQRQDLHFFLITPFSQTHHGDTFSHPRCILPMRFYIRRGTRIMSGHIQGWQEFQKRKLSISGICASAQMQNVTPPPLLERVDFPDEDMWTPLVQKATARIRSGLCQKLVLARRSDFLVPETPSRVQTFCAFSRPQKNTFRYFFQHDDQAFFGASPELLACVEGQSLETEALAGTAGMERALFSEKNMLEHEWVVEDMRARLFRFSQVVQSVSQPEACKFSSVFHLRSRLRAEFAGELQTADILRHLHPSAAICGYPEQEARDFLDQAESFDRGYYAGAVGVLSSVERQLAISLRAFRWRDDVLSFFAGVGIVEQSQAEEEWQELEAKLHSAFSFQNTPSLRTEIRTEQTQAPQLVQPFSMKTQEFLQACGGERGDA